MRLEGGVCRRHFAIAAHTVVFVGEDAAVLQVQACIFWNKNHRTGGRRGTVREYRAPREVQRLAVNALALRIQYSDDLSPSTFCPGALEHNALLTDQADTLCQYLQRMSFAELILAPRQPHHAVRHRAQPAQQLHVDARCDVRLLHAAPIQQRVDPPPHRPRDAEPRQQHVVELLAEHLAVVRHPHQVAVRAALVIGALRSVVARPRVRGAAESG